MPNSSMMRDFRLLGSVTYPPCQTKSLFTQLNNFSCSYHLRRVLSPCSQYLDSSLNTLGIWMKLPNTHYLIYHIIEFFLSINKFTYPMIASIFPICTFVFIFNRFNLFYPFCRRKMKTFHQKSSRRNPFLKPCIKVTISIFLPKVLTVEFSKCKGA